MASSKETFSALLAICVGNSPVTSEFPAEASDAVFFFYICAWINGWVNNGEAGDLRCYRARYDVTVMGLNTDSYLRVGRPGSICIFARSYQFHIPSNSWVWYIYWNIPDSVTHSHHAGKAGFPTTKVMVKPLTASILFTILKNSAFINLYEHITPGWSIS